MDIGFVMPSPPFEPGATIPAEIAELHNRCGIFTQDTTARSMLESIGWTVDADLSHARLLDPCVGDGAFIVPAVEILLASLQRLGISLTQEALEDRIFGVEIHRSAFAEAKGKICAALTRMEIDEVTALKLSNAWLHNDDFLLRDFTDQTFTHVVANPPYLRWANLPTGLSTTYRAMLPRAWTSGDLSVAFIARMIDLASDGGRIALLSSDRWLHAAYAEDFRAKWMKAVRIDRIEKVNPRDVFRIPVSTYPVIARLIKETSNRSNERIHSSPMGGALTAIVDEWLASFPPIVEAGCEIRVGPALGCEQAFVGQAEDLAVETELLVPYVRPRDIVGDSIVPSGNRALNVHAPNGGLIDLRQFPKAARHLEQFREKLEQRSCVKGAPDKLAERWYRTIDRADPKIWSRSKILVPEIVRTPRVALDDTGCQPSHGIYAIFSEEWPLSVLRDVLASGVFGIVMECIAPRLNGDCKRCYKRFLSRLPLPRWGDLERATRKKLINASAKGNRAQFSDSVSRIYRVDVALLAEFATTDWRTSPG